MSCAPIRALPSSANAWSASRTAAVSSPSCASQVRAASRYVLPTIRSWVSTTASARNISHSTGADRENREAAIVREFAEPVGEVALPLPAQPRDPVRRDIVEKAFRNIEAPEVFEAVQQPVGGGGIAARLELPEPDEPRHAGVDRLVEQMLKVAPKPGRDPLGDAGFDPAFRVDQRVGAEPLDRRRGRQDGSRATARLDEPADQILVRLRLWRFFAEPVAELARRAAREGPESVQVAQLSKMLVPGLGPHRVVGELIPVQIDLASDEIHDGRRNELGRNQQAARVAEHAQLQREAQLVAGTPLGSDVLQVFVAQGVVAQQVRLALRQGEQGRPSAGWSGRFSVPFSFT